MIGGAHALLATVDWHLVWERIINPDGSELRALGTTVYVAVLAELFGVALGLLAALMRQTRAWPMRLLSNGYVIVFRGTPVIVQIFFIYFGANLLLGFTLIPRALNLGLFTLPGPVLAGIIALALNEGAYQREIIRACIDAVDHGQLEAARSLGMTSRLGMRRIVLPQAAKIFVPPLGNQFNYMMKTTALLSFIGVYELFQDAEAGYSATFKPVEYFAAVGFWYLVLTGVWHLIQRRIEHRLGASERGDVPLRGPWRPWSVLRLPARRAI